MTLTLVVVGYDEMGDWFLLDENNNQVPFETYHVDTFAQAKEKFGIEKPS